MKLELRHATARSFGGEPGIADRLADCRYQTRCSDGRDDPEQHSAGSRARLQAFASAEEHEHRNQRRTANVNKTLEPRPAAQARGRDRDAAVVASANPRSVR